MPAYPTQIHVICCQRKPYFVLLESKSRNVLCIDDIWVFFSLKSISGSSLYILVLCGELLRLVMSHCCAFIIFFVSFPSLVLCVCQLSCASQNVYRIALCGHVPAATLCSDPFVIVLNKTLIHVKRRYYRSKLYEQICRLALFLGPLATLDVIFTFLEVQFVSL